MRRWATGIPIASLGLWLAGGLVSATEPARTLRVSASTASEVGSWDDRIAGMLRVGALRVRQVREDALLPGRTHERLTQLHRGIPVFGGELVRQTGPAGATVSVFGTLYEGIEVDATPLLSRAQVESLIAKRGLAPFGSEGTPELTVLPLDSGGYALTWRLRAVPAGSAKIRMVFLDARTGDVVLEYSDLQTQSAVGAATGVLLDAKKISASSGGAGFIADDRLRPPAILTYDFKGALSRLLLIDDVSQLQSSDLATDADNTWTDGPNVDAHVYAGYTYDYYFKRHGRRGLDNANITVRSVTHPARRADFLSYINDEDIIFTFYVNAFYAGDGLMVYGEGLPPSFTLGGQSWNYLAGALDVVAHELTHGVTDYSSRLIYRNESGALNESFSDMMGTAVEFFFQPPGSGPLKADYLLGEDVITPGGLRSLQNPIALGDPDHYSVRYTGEADNGGVHTNSGIGNQAFYLAIEGGRNRVSGLTVQGVGAANREQIEKVFYRAFTQLLPPSANFATARAATIQSARDLYNPGSAAESAVIQAWNAVGVN
jgi:thermolysin